MSNSPHTLVIGGGVAGLLAARDRARAGHDVTVLEADDHCGGAVWSHEVGGVEVNTGAEAFAIGRGAVLGLVKELGIDSMMVSPAQGTSFIVGDHGAYPSPKNAIMGLPSSGFAPDVRRAIGLVGALRVMCERVLPSRVGVREGVTVGDFVRARYGRRVLERLVSPIIQGVHSANPDALELRSILPQLPALIAEHGSAQKAIEQMLRERGARTGSGAAVHSLVPSMAQLPKALVRDIEELGGTIVTDARVTRLRVGRSADGQPVWTATTIAPSMSPGNTDGSNSPGPSTAAQVSAGSWDVSDESIDDARSVTATHVVIATGPEIARDLLKEASPQVAQLIPEAPAIPVRLVTLALDNPELHAKPRGNGVLVAPGSRTIRAKALTHASAKWEHVGAAASAVAKGRHLVRLSYGRSDGKALPELTEFPQRAVEDAARILGLEPSALNVSDYAITEWEGTMRQSGPGHAATLEAITRVLERVHGTGADSGAATTPAPLPPLELTGAWRAGNGLEAITRFSSEHSLVRASRTEN